MIFLCKQGDAVCYEEVLFASGHNGCNLVKNIGDPIKGEITQAHAASNTGVCNESECTASKRMRLWCMVQRAVHV